MAYELDCDACEFGETVEAENAAYVTAKEHESEYPNHFVLIYAIN